MVLAHLLGGGEFMPDPWRCLSSIACRVSSVSNITTRNNFKDIKSIFSANVYHVPGLCLLGIDGTPYIVTKLEPGNKLTSYVKVTSRWLFKKKEPSQNF